MSLRLGVIGGGFGQQVVVPAARSLSGIEVAGIATAHADTAREIARKLSIPFHTHDWRELLDQKMDFYYVGVPPIVQEDVIEELVRRRMPFLCEKPLGVNLPRLERIVAAAGPDYPALVDFEFTQIPTWREARALLDQLLIGPIEHIEVDWRTMQYANKHRLESWKTRAAEGGAALNMFGTHALYSLMFFGGDIASLDLSVGKKPTDPRATHTFCNAAVNFTSGAKGRFHLDCDNATETCHRITIRGRDGTLTLDQRPDAGVLGGFTLDVVSPEGHRTSSADFALAPGTDSRIAGVAGILSLLLERMKNPRTPGPDLMAGLKVQRKSALEY